MEKEGKDKKAFSWVGPSCGHHASYAFYKAIRYTHKKTGAPKILSLGEFFFVKVWEDSDLVSIGELQLLWEDRSTNQTLGSLRLYYLPEYTQEGRLPEHGEDEVVAVAEKCVLQISDLLDWIADPKEISWDRGLLGFANADCEPPPPPLPAVAADKAAATNGDPGSGGSSNDGGSIGSNGSNGGSNGGSVISSIYYPGHTDFLADVRQEKASIGDVPSASDPAVIVLSTASYIRYRSVATRIAGRERRWMRHSIVRALGGFTTETSKTRILYCGESFDYPELEEHPYLCNHLAPKLKGRPRKRRKVRRAGSPESESASSESSVSTTSANAAAATRSNARNGIKVKDLLSILSQKNTKEELDFLKKLTGFMEKRNTPIERPPMLGFKQIDLHLFYQKVEKSGGYEGCMTKKAWKSIYDELGGNPQNTSAATCTRRHYEKFLLPFERHMRGQSSKAKKKSASASGSATEGDSSEKESKSPQKSPGEVIGGEDLVTPKEVDGEHAKPAEEEDSKMIEGGEEEKPLASTATATAAGAAAEGNSGGIIAPGLASLMQSSKPDQKTTLDPDGKRLQIDDLIIIPGNHGLGMAGLPGAPPPGPEGGGSALKNLAMIASRYQGTKPSKDGGDCPEAKRARVESGDGSRPVSQPLPASPHAAASAAKKPPSSSPSPMSLTSPSSATAALAATNSLLSSFLPPELLQPMGWPPGSAAAAKTPSAMPGAAGAKGASPLPGIPPALASLFADPSKLGPAEYSLLQFYEKQLKAATEAQKKAAAAVSGSGGAGGRGATASPAASSTNSTASSTVSKDGGGQSKKEKEKEKERLKVCKPPPETKRPPRLMQTPCAFVQTSTFYTNPLAEITKVKSSSKSSMGIPPSSSAVQPPSGSDVLDLSRARPPGAASLFQPKSDEYKPLHIPPPMQIGSATLSPLPHAPPPLGPTSSGTPMLDLSLKRDPSKPELKASPFSAEALLSRPSPKPQSAQHDLVKIAPMAALTGADIGKSSLFSRSAHPDPKSSKSSPWHTPVPPSISSSSSAALAALAKPAIPVSPVVREDKSKPDSFSSSSNPFGALLSSLGAAAASSVATSMASTPTSTPISMSLPPTSYSTAVSMASMAANPSMSMASMASIAANPSMAAMLGMGGQGGGGAMAANPYLALMAAGKPPSASPSVTSGYGPPGGPAAATAALMDPATSAYYAALYSQQMYGAAGLSPYASAAGLGALGLGPQRTPGPPQAPPGGSSAAAAAALAGLDPLQASALQAMLARSAGAPPGSASPSPYAGYPGIPGFPPGFPPRKD